MNEITTAPPGVIELTPENLTELLGHPLWAVPFELRTPVWNLWMLYQRFFSSPLGVSAAIASDMSRGLEVRDALVILDNLIQPETRSTFKFGAEFDAELARQTAYFIKKRRTEREYPAKRAAAAPSSNERAAVDSLLGTLADRFIGK